MSTLQQNHIKSAAFAKAWEGPEFRLRFVEDPPGALGELGVQLAPGAALKVVEDTSERHHWVIPMAPPEELKDGDLDQAAGGAHAFHPEVDDEVLVDFLNKDPRDPVVIGVMWNGVDKARK